MFPLEALSQNIESNYDTSFSSTNAYNYISLFGIKLSWNHFAKMSHEYLANEPRVENKSTIWKSINFHSIDLRVYVCGV